MSWIPDIWPKPDALLRELAIKSPRDIDVGAIAEFCGADVEVDGLDGSQASLVGLGDRAIITVKRDSDPVDRRFSIAHELGHWNLDRGTVLFDCDRGKLGEPFSVADRWQLMNTWSRTYRALDKDGPEPAANRWAAELLMPDRFFLRDVAGRPVTFETARELAEIYRTSLTETARRLVSRSPFPSMLIYNGPGPEHQRWHERGPGIPSGVWPRFFPYEGTVAYGLWYGSRDAPGPMMVRADEWVMFGRDRPWLTVCEDSVLLGENEVLTLLWFKDEAVLRSIVDPDHPDVLAEEDRMLQERFRRRVAYRETGK